MNLRRDTAPITAKRLRAVYEARLAAADAGAAKPSPEAADGARELLRALAEIADDESVDVEIRGSVAVFTQSDTGRVLREVPLSAPERARPADGTTLIDGPTGRED